MTSSQHKQPSLFLGTTSEGESITLTGQSFPYFIWCQGVSGSGKSVLLAWIVLPITQLQRFLLDASFRNTLLGKVKDQQIIQFFDFQFSDKVNSNLISSTMRRLDLLTFSPKLRQCLGQKENKLNFRNLWDKNMS